MTESFNDKRGHEAHAVKRPRRPRRGKWRTLGCSGARLLPDTAISEKNANFLKYKISLQICGLATGMRVDRREE